MVMTSRFRTYIKAGGMMPLSLMITVRSKTNMMVDELPRKVITHIQNTAPGPPMPMAVATPAILPVPTRPDMASGKA